MGSIVNSTKIPGLSARKQKLRDLNMTETEISNFFIREMGPRNAAENLNDFWRNWREGKGGNDMYKIGDGKRKIDFIDNLIKSDEFRKKMSDQNILDEIEKVTITDEPNPPTMKIKSDDESETSGITITDIPNPPNPPKINPIDIDPSDPIGRRGKPSTKKVKVETVQKVIPGVQGETTPEEEMNFQKGVAPTVNPTVESTVVPKVSKPIDLSKQVSSKAMDISTPSTIDQIPESRLSSDNKSQDQLRSDINYFLKNFPTPLKNIKSQAKRLNKMGLVQLQRLHKRIVNILQPNKMATSGKKVGVVIDAEEYIKRKVGEVMIDNAIKGYQIPNLQPVGDNIDNKSDGTKDIGSYEIKVGPEGGLNSQKEPVYRYIPTTNEEGVNEIEYNYESKRKPKRMALPKTKMRNQVVTGKREVRTNPFLEKQGGHRLNVLL